MQPIRKISWSFIFLLLLLFSLCFSAFILWWYSPAIVKSVVENELVGTGVSITSFEMRRPESWKIEIDDLQLASAENLLGIGSLILSPLDNSSLSINASSVMLSLQANSQAGQGLMSWRDALDLLGSSLLLLPKYGLIDQIQICQPLCRAASLSWGRDGGVTNALITIHDPLLHISLALEQGRRGATLMSLKQFPALVTIDMLDLDDLSAVTATANAKLTGDAIEISTADDVSARFESSAVEVDAKLNLPLDRSLSSFTTDDLEASVNARLSSIWNMAWQDIGVIGSRQLSLSGVLHEGKLEMENLLPIDLEIDNPYVANAHVSVGAKSRCVFTDTKQFDKIHLSCKPSIITSTAGYEDYEIAAELTDNKVLMSEADLDVSSLLNLKIKKSGSDFFNGEFSVNGSPRAIEWRSTHAALLDIPLALVGNQDLTSEQGQLKLDIKHQLSASKKTLKRLGIAGLDIKRGEVRVNGTYTWVLDDLPSLRQRTQVELLGAGFSYDGYVVNGLSGTTTLVGWPVLKTDKPVQLSLRQLDIGVPLEELKTAFDVSFDSSRSEFSVKGVSLSTNLFGGTVATDQFAYRSKTASGTADMRFDGIQLDKILALQRQDLASSGVLQGSVPVQIKAGKLSIENGAIDAVAPGGFIRYLPEASVISLAKDNAGLKVVLDAMTDFQYHRLHAKINYTPEGLMVAETSIEGSNPGYQGGREVHLNLNLEENINTLLESLRLGADIADKVSKKTAKGTH